MLLSPGVSLNIFKGVDSDSWEEFSFKEIDRSEVKENAVSTGNVDKNLSSVSFSDLQAEDEHGERGGKGKKSPGWSKIGLAIGEMEANVPRWEGSIQLSTLQMFLGINMILRWK